MASSSRAADAWHIVVPLKTLAAAKSRLAGVDRVAMARAMAADVLAACRTCSRVGNVTVVSSEPEQWVGTTLVPDPGDGLNAAVSAGIAHQPPGAAVAVVVGDLPCLTPEQLAALLDAAAPVVAAGGSAVVPDRGGDGTTVLMGAAPGPVPHFGPGSLAAHVAAGAVALVDPGWAALRIDVDDADELAAAVAHGVGPETRAALRP